MSDITPERLNIQQEETAAQAAVSEATLSRLGAGINFINDFQSQLWQFNINGKYNTVTTFPNIQVDGIFSFPYAWEIVNLYIYTGQTVGTGSTTELDLKWAANASSTYASIFSTTPKFTTTAAANDTCYVGESKTGFTTPVLSKSTFAIKDKVRFDILAAMTGPVRGAGIGLHIRPI